MPLIPFAIKSIRDPGDWNARLRLERAAIRDLERALDGQLRQIMHDLRAGKTVDEVLAGLATTPELRAKLERMLLNATDLGVLGAESALGVGIDWTLANLAARDWASTYSYELVRGINETSRRVLQRAVSRWTESGEPLSVLQKDLVPYFGRRRASMISSTEVTRAYSQANVETFKQNGVLRHRWNTANDEIVCPICRPLNGQIVTIGSAFTGGITQPPAHVNCRCWTVGIVEET